MQNLYEPKVELPDAQFTLNCGQSTLCICKCQAKLNKLQHVYIASGGKHMKSVTQHYSNIQKLNQRQNSNKT